MELKKGLMAKVLKSNSEEVPVGSMVELIERSLWGDGWRVCYDGRTTLLYGPMRGKNICFRDDSLKPIAKKVK